MCLEAWAPDYLVAHEWDTLRLGKFGVWRTAGLSKVYKKFNLVLASLMLGNWGKAVGLVAIIIYQLSQFLFGNVVDCAALTTWWSICLRTIKQLKEVQRDAYSGPCCFAGLYETFGAFLRNSYTNNVRSKLQRKWWHFQMDNEWLTAEGGQTTFLGAKGAERDRESSSTLDKVHLGMNV